MKKNLDISDINFSPRFNKQLTKAPDEIKLAFLDALELFVEDQSNPILRNHALRKKFTGYKSIDVTGDCRAVFKEKQQGNQKIIVFYTLGTHKELYGGK